MGKAYHPSCFTCVVCHRGLDGIPFTVDATSQIHCIEDFHRSGCISHLCLGMVDPPHFSFMPQYQPPQFPTPGFVSFLLPVSLSSKIQYHTSGLFRSLEYPTLSGFHG